MASGNSADGTPPLVTYTHNKHGSRSAKDLENGTATRYTYDMDTTGPWERSGETAAGSPAGSPRWRKRANYPAVGSRTQEAPADATGTLVESYTYDAFGAPSIFDASGSALSASPRENRFLFTGRERFAGIATYDYRNRAYNATLGRFLQTDPIGFDAGDVNLYRYVANNPVSWVDPLGLLKEGKIGIKGEWKHTGGGLNIFGGSVGLGAGVVLDSGQNIHLEYSAPAEVECLCEVGTVQKKAKGTRVATRGGHLGSLPNVLFFSPSRVPCLSALIRKVATEMKDAAPDPQQLAKEFKEQADALRPSRGDVGDGWKGGKSPCA